jgi:hypothetical protein
MNSQFLKDHLLDFEVVAAVVIALILIFASDVGWLLAVPAGLSAFIIVPLVLSVAFHIKAII